MTIEEKRQDFLDSYFKGFEKLFPPITQEIFLKYYDESIYRGYPTEPAGSVFESEGKSIYVLIRILKPKNILEIGNYMGKSSNHILQAVEDNKVGEVTLLDIVERIDYDSIHNKNFNRVLNNSLIELDAPFDYDLIVQDGDHTYPNVKKELELIFKHSQSKSLHIWAHDYYSVKAPQCEVAKAWDEVVDKFNNISLFKDSVSNCGCLIAHFNKA
jgi:hypothetical protein